jgi:hypothetical protein
MERYLMMTRRGQRPGCFTPAAAQIAVRKDPYNTLALPVTATEPGALQAELLEDYDLEVESVEVVGSIEGKEVVKVNLRDAADLPDELPHLRERGHKLIWVTFARLEEMLPSSPDLLALIAAHM